MSNRKAKHLARLNVAQPCVVAALKPEVSPVAVKLKRAVTQQRAREQVRLGEDLEPIADA